jgi:hypothetical protein
MQIAARASWVAPVVAFVIGLSVRRMAPPSAGAWLATRVVCGLVMAFGVGSGGVALAGVKRRGPENLIVPAGIGLGVSMVVALIWIVMSLRGGE